MTPYTTMASSIGQWQDAVPGIGRVVAEKAVAIDPDYARRTGVRPGVPGHACPLPVLTADQRADAAPNRRAADGQDPTVLNYHRFSLVMHRTRRLARYTFVNVDGRVASRPGVIATGGTSTPPAWSSRSRSVRISMGTMILTGRVKFAGDITYIHT
ncbi:UNVERIFIED_ORG: hypothetical protein J2X79_004264 [Arthrobacter globiformis]|nr:hypothetical protein [Arthrobacter globiformis]